MAKQLFISIFLIILLLGCNGINKQRIDSKNEESNIELSEHRNANKVIRNFQKVKKSGLEDKKFYFLKEGGNRKLVLIKYPQFSGDFEMEKYIFKNNKFIDGNNVMEPTEYNINEILKNDSIIRYVLSMVGNPTSIDTFDFKYNTKKNLLYRIWKKNPPTVLIDSIYSNEVNAYIEIEE